MRTKTRLTKGYVCNCTWPCVTIVHTIEGLTSLLITCMLDTHAFGYSAAILGHTNVVLTT